MKLTAFEFETCPSCLSLDSMFNPEYAVVLRVWHLSDNSDVGAAQLKYYKIGVRLFYYTLELLTY